MYSLGRAEYGRLGLGQGAEEKTEPTLVSGIEAACNVTCGASVSFAVTREGEKRMRFLLSVTLLVCCLNWWCIFLCLYSRVGVCLGDGHKPAAWHRRRGWWVQPRENDGEAAGKPCSTDGVQRGAAHGASGQRQAGELIPASTWEGRGHFIVWGFGLVRDVEYWFNGVVQCLSHCLSQIWMNFSPFMWEPFLLSLEKACVSSVDHDKDCFFKKSYFWHSLGTVFTKSLVWMLIKVFNEFLFNYLFLCVWLRLDVCSRWLLPGALKNTVLTIGTCLVLWILLYTAFCCLSYQENKVYSWFFFFFFIYKDFQFVNYLTANLQVPLFKDRSLPVTTEQPFSCTTWFHQLFYICLLATCNLAAFMFLIEHL